MAIQFKRGTKAKRDASSLVLDAGQPLFESDTNKLYIGDGTTEVKSLKPVVAEKLSFDPAIEDWPYGNYEAKINTDGIELGWNKGTGSSISNGYLGCTLTSGSGKYLTVEDGPEFSTNYDHLTAQGQGFYVLGNIEGIKRYIIPDLTSSNPQANSSNTLITKDDMTTSVNNWTRGQNFIGSLAVGDSAIDTSLGLSVVSGIYMQPNSINIGNNNSSYGNLGLSSNGSAQTISATGDLNLQAHKILTMAAVNDLSVISNGGNIAINAGTTSTGKLLQLQSTTGSPTVVTVTPVTIGSTSMTTIGEQFTIVPKTRTPQAEMLSLGFCQDSTSSDLYPVIRYNDAIGNRMWLRFPDLGDDQEGTIATLENLPTIPHTKYLHRLDIYAYNSSYYVYAYMDIINDSSTAIGTIDVPKLTAAVLNNSVSGSIPCTGYINSKSSTSVYYPIVKFQASSGPQGNVTFGFLNSTKYDTVIIRTLLPSGTSITIKDNVIPFTV